MRYSNPLRIAALAALMVLVGCTANQPPPTPSIESRPEPKLVSVSYYGGSDGLHGARTASGERFDCHALTAAHKTLPFGTMVTLTNPSNRRHVTVRINDRGPFVRGRELDISLAAAKELGIAGAGVAKVQMTIQR